MSESPHPKYHLCQVLFHLVHSICRRLKCEKITDGCKVMAIAYMTLRSHVSKMEVKIMQRK